MSTQRSSLAHMASRLVSIACATLCVSTLAAATATPASSDAHQQTYSRPAQAFTYRQSAWAPTAVSSLVQVGGSLTRSSATYSLERAAASNEGAQSWTVAVKGNKGGWVEATVGKGADKRKLDLIPAAVQGESTLYSLDLSAESTASSAVVTISTVQTQQTVPFPRKLAQTVDSVYFLWTGDLLASIEALPQDQRSHVKEVKVRVKAPAPRLASLETPDAFDIHTSTGSATITYTSKEGSDFASLGPQMARVHFQEPQAVASLRKLDRIVELSHWGNNLAIQDSMDLYNSGPELEGQFARIDYQKMAMMRRQGVTAISSLSLSLPSSASSPYYYDVVGNVSTSHFRSAATEPKNPSKVVLPSQQKRLNALKPAILELKPRYPIFGGWNYSFTIGYDLPLGEYVRQRKEGRGKYLAAVPFLTPIKDVAVEQARVEIRLPEGARDIHVRTPFPVSSLSYPAFVPRLFGGHHTVQQGGAVSWTYLDSTGRPTVVLTKEGCTDMHGGDVLIEYTLPLFVEWFQKPIACASALAMLFIAIGTAKRVKTAIPS